MNPAERDRAIKAAAEILEILKTLPVTTPCASCLHFDPDEKGWCRRWAAMVPKDAQAAGCSEWQEQIPF